VLAFAYILIAVIVALAVPLAVNLGERARTEQIGQAEVTAQALSAVIGAEALAPGDRGQLQRRAERYSEQIGGRVLVMDSQGEVLADANPFPEPPSAVGENYDTPSRPEIQIALQQGRTDAQIRRSDSLGTDILVAAAPIIDDTVEGGPTGIAGATRITLDVQEVSEAVRNVTIGIVVIGLGGLLAGLLIAFGLAGSLARPLRELAATAKRLGDGDLGARAGDIKGPKEVEDLAATFDEMADRVERTFDAQRSFVANASHQLRTPLTGMKLRIERATDEAADPDQRRQLEAADIELDRMAATVDRMLEMARDIEEGAPTDVDLAREADLAVLRWADRAVIAESTVSATTTGEVRAHANPKDVEQILDNLIDNALLYAPGSVVVQTGTRGARAFLAVADRGPGIAPEERANVTERFARGKGAPAGGSGLGLAIARDLAEKWGGALAVAEGDGGGTRVEISFSEAPRS
jgi:two-component system, OmpR family, sensor kinase